MSRWTWYDATVPETWVMRKNPASMTSPLNTRDVKALGRVAGSPLVAVSKKLVDWSFSGLATDPTEYSTLVAWASKRYPVQLTDHLGRVFTVRVYQFKVDEQHPSRAFDQKFAYTVTAYVLGGP